MKREGSELAFSQETNAYCVPVGQACGVPKVTVQAALGVHRRVVGVTYVPGSQFVPLAVN